MGVDLITDVTKELVKRREYPKFSTGDTIAVSVRVKEGEKERIQVFKGVVLKVQGSGVGSSFTVRKVSDGVGVERTFPFASPMIESIEAINRGKIRQGRLFYLRNLRGRAARLTTELVRPEDATVSES